MLELRQHAAIAMGLLAFLISLDAAAQYPVSPHFRIRKLGKGVYAAIAEKGGAAICNAGIVDMGEGVLIFDPFMVPEAAADLKKAAEALTGKRISYVVNSHWHIDHVGGNAVFADAEIISTASTRQAMSGHLKNELDAMKMWLPPALLNLSKKDTASMSRFEADEHRMWKGYYSALSGKLDNFPLQLPVRSFEGRMTLKGSKTGVELIAFSGGHTESDLVLFLPRQGILFAGDLLFSGHHPWLGDGSPQVWSRQLDSLVLLKPKILLPGHGDSASINDVMMMKKYFNAVTEQALGYLKSGKVPEDDILLVPGAPFNQWHLVNFFRMNVAEMLSRLKASLHEGQ